MLKKLKLLNRKSMSSFQVIIFSFLGLILIGALLLMLPISSRERCVTPFSDALFTAVSSTCVTGLVVKDTATYWSLFGQTVILILIQIGGMGVITIALAIMMASGRKIGLWHRSTMQESISAPQVGGIVRMTGFILKTSALIELIGAALLSPVFFRDFGFFRGLWYSLFHSISAFCNAGFDLLGVRGQFSSLTSYGDDVYLNTVIMLLIVTGGIGFLVWSDIATYRQHLKRYSLQSKVVLLTSQYHGSFTDGRIRYRGHDLPHADRRFPRFHGGRHEDGDLRCAVSGGGYGVQPEKRRPVLQETHLR